MTRLETINPKLGRSAWRAGSQPSSAALLVCGLQPGH